MMEKVDKHKDKCDNNTNNKKNRKKSSNNKKKYKQNCNVANYWKNQTGACCLYANKKLEEMRKK